MTNTFRNFIIFLISFIAIDVQAEYIAPSDVVVKTPPVSVSPWHLKEVKYGSYFYDVSWQGIPVAEAVVNIKASNVKALNDLSPVSPQILLTATAKTNKAIGLFYKLRHSSSSRLNAKTMKPLSFNLDQKENSKSSKVEITFAEDGLIKSRSEKTDKEPRIFEFNSHNDTLDPVSASFLARFLPFRPNKVISFDIFNGKHRYLISFELIKLEELYLNKKKILAYKFKPIVKKLTETEGEKNLKSAFLWVSADKSRTLLKLESKVWLGSVTAKLNRFESE